MLVLYDSVICSGMHWSSNNITHILPEYQPGYTQNYDFGKQFGLQVKTIA